MTVDIPSPKMIGLQFLLGSGFGAIIQTVRTPPQVLATTANILTALDSRPGRPASNPCLHRNLGPCAVPVSGRFDIPLHRSEPVRVESP